MSLDNFGDAYTQETVNEFGRNLLNKYGEEVCKAATAIDQGNLASDSTRSYKPQIRQILSGCQNTNPDPRDVVNHISETDKKSGTKSLMVSAMERYYKAIDHDSKATELRELSKSEGITDKNFNTESTISGWITKDEMLKIEQNILPDESERINHLSFADSSWVISVEHKALTMTLFYTACRVGEICKQNSDDQSLLVEDIYPETNEINLYRLKKKGKGYKRDMTAVPGKLIDCLQEYMDMNNIDKGNLFPFTTRTAQNKIKEIDEAYQYAFGKFKHMEKLTPHKFRHGRITDIANNTGLEEAGEYVDHASPETTQQYKHITTEEQRKMLPEESGDSTDEKIIELMDELEVDSVEEALDKVNSD